MKVSTALSSAPLATLVTANLTAQRGAEGQKGEKGDKGDKGDPGEPGKDGRDGKDGTPGRDGDQGAKGDPGRDGTDGAPGRAGRDGTDGSQGLKGEPGDPGRDGSPGKDGAPGKDGSPGLKGDPGDKGDKGDPGTAGAVYRNAASPATTAKIWTTTGLTDSAGQVVFTPPAGYFTAVHAATVTPLRPNPTVSQYAFAFLTAIGASSIAARVGESRTVPPIISALGVEGLEASGAGVIVQLVAYGT
ncbi:hypothetical protein [Kribbella albertanoniae]|uniref:hypothetical protein n=1 Tax=Kribbella albertanoniae TaxID=1266829 RepID=UPI0014053759|nr:hypothetical protein [Kribbella albertanoniae]